MNSPELLDPESHGLLEAFCGHLSGVLGLDIPRRRWPEVARAVRVAAREQGCPDVPGCIERMLSQGIDPETMDVIIHHLTVGETYFFRDPAAFAALRDHILPPLIRSRGSGPAEGRRLRIWSAGCSTGEEAYSIAIALQECVPDWERWHITLLATDVNRAALAIARQGVYRDWSFRTTSPEFRARHFQRLPDGHYRIDERLKAMVSFLPLNLAEDAYPAVGTNTTAMDVIFCRNVLMYLQPEHVQRAVARLQRSLCEGGWLMVSAVEAGLAATPGLVCERLPGVLLFRKGEAAVPPAARRSSVSKGGNPPPAAIPRTGRPFRGGEIVRPPEREAAQAPADADSMRVTARTLANAGRLDDALAWCERALAQQPLDAVGAYLRGSILLEQGRMEEAVAAFRRSLYFEPGLAVAQFALGNALAAQGRDAQAAKHYRHALTGLRALPPGQALPEADDLPAGQLVRMIEAILGMESAA